MQAHGYITGRELLALVLAVGCGLSGAASALVALALWLMDRNPSGWAIASAILLVAGFAAWLTLRF